MEIKVKPCPVPLRLKGAVLTCIHGCRQKSCSNCERFCSKLSQVRFAKPCGVTLVTVVSTIKLLNSLLRADEYHDTSI